MKKIFLFSLAIMCVLSTIISSYSGTVLAQEDLDVKSNHYVVIHEDTFDVLIESNAHARRQVASICKLMTVYITCTKINNGDITLEDKVYASTYATSMEGSRAYLDNEYYTVSDLLKSVIVASANDSAVALAEYIAGSEAEFVNLMNSTAISLNMDNTLYANATGLPSAGQYSSAYDTAIILSNVSKFDIYREYSQIWIDSITHLSGRVTELVNTNRLLKYYDNVVCGKTGFTDEAGYCLSSIVDKDGIRVIVVVLNLSSPSDRFSDSMALYNYIYDNYYMDTILDTFDMIDNDIKITKGKSGSINLGVKDSIIVLQHKSNPINYILKYDLPYSKKAPIYKGETIGYVDLIRDGIVINTYEVVSSVDIEKASYVDYIKDIVKRFGQS